MERLGTTNAAAAAARLHQAVVDFSEGRADAARLACGDILAIASDDAGALHLLGLIEYRAGNHAEARRLLCRATEAPGATALFWLSYAEFGCKAQDRGAAIAAVRRAVAMDEASPLGWHCLGNLMLEAGRYDEARDGFEKALARDARFWEARAQLAMAQGRLGEPAAAMAQFERLLAEVPGNGRVFARFAALLQDFGRYEEALTQVECGIAQDPQALDLHLQAAGVESLLGRHAAALERLQTAEGRWPDEASLLTLKMHLLRQLDRNDEAVAIGRDGASKGISSAAFLRALALSLQLVGGEAEALTLFDRAAAADPALAPWCRTDQAVLLTDMGRLDAAIDLFDRVLAGEPTFADGWYNKSNAKTYRAQDPDIAAMLGLLQRGTGYRDRLLLHFALGKALFEAGDADRAFEHWNEGNRMKRATFAYDPDAAAARMAAIVAQPWSAASPAAAERGSELPVFIVGMPRSGSSLIEQILAAHPDVYGAGELLQLRALFEAGLPPAGSAAAGRAERRLAQAALERLRRRSGRALRVIDKDLANFQHLGTIHRVFPRARIVHCRRDPLDSCFSAYTKLFAGDLGFAYELGELGRYHRGYQDLMAHWRALLPAAVFLEVDYEAVVADPEAVTRRLLDFLGLPWDAACTKFFESKRTVRTSSSTQVRRPVYRTSVGRAAALSGHLQPLIAALEAGT